MLKEAQKVVPDSCRGKCCLIHTTVSRKMSCWRWKPQTLREWGLSVCVCPLWGMLVCLCGCLTDLVSKSEVGQNVNQSRMEQTEEEWLSNHPNLFFFSPHYPPAVLQLWASQEVFRGGVFRVEAGWGHCAVGPWDGRIEERHLAHCHSTLYSVLILQPTVPFTGNIWHTQSVRAHASGTVLPFWTIIDRLPLSHMFT